MVKKVALLFSDYPFGTSRFSERLRMALGLSLNDDNSLSLIFLKNSRHALGRIDESAIGTGAIQKNVDMLIEMGASLFVENGDGFDYLDSYQKKMNKFDSLEPLIADADVVIT